jgi:hypothetical protein
MLGPSGPCSATYTGSSPQEPTPDVARGLAGVLRPDQDRIVRIGARRGRRQRPELGDQADGQVDLSAPRRGLGLLDRQRVPVERLMSRQSSEHASPTLISVMVAPSLR